VNPDARTLLTALGEDGYLSVCWKPPGADRLGHTVTTVAEATAIIDAIGDTADLWYGVNRMAVKPASGRGRAADITRITCLYADLDTGKPLTPGSITEARTIIDGLPDPAFIIYSGHGLQPIWPLTGDEFSTSDPAILARWGQLIADRSADRGWVTDNVYDLARILRVPGTVNHKYPDRPVRASLEMAGGAALDHDEVIALLDDHERTRPVRRKVTVSGPSRPAASSHMVRQWLDTSVSYQRAATPYGAQAIDELLAEYSTRENSRHRWMVRSVTRIIELAANGDVDIRASLSIIRDRFTQLIAGERPALPEFIDGLAWGVGQLAAPEDGSGDPEDAPPVANPIAARLMTGDIILDEPSTPPAIWGEGENVAWSEGESLIIAGPDGVGKTTVAGQVIKARLGIGPGAVLGMPVKPGSRNLLYLMMDRPRQIRRALRRIFTEDNRIALKERLVLWQGPPPADLARDTGMLLNLCQLADADTVIVDSLKDAALKLSDDETGAGWNRARQNVTAAGIEILELHHPRKEQSDNKKPATLADLFGSRWISAGAGSVIMLWGKAGDPVIEFIHLKQPSAEVGPWRIMADRQAGTVERERGIDLIQQIRNRGAQGITADVAARLITGTESPTRAEIEKARRRLDRAVSDGILRREDQRPVTWFLKSRRDSHRDKNELSRGSHEPVKTYPPGTDFMQVNSQNDLSRNQSRTTHAGSAPGVVTELGGISTPVRDSCDQDSETAGREDQTIGSCTSCFRPCKRYGNDGTTLCDECAARPKAEPSVAQP
jgi:hypothetical protein